MAILVTGGAGYIGSHTAVALADSGHEVVLLDNFSNSDFKAVENIRSLITSEVPFYEVDIRDRDALALVFQAQKDLSSPISSVIHFAALKSVGESVSKPELYHDNNTGGTKTLLEVMSEFAVRKIVFLLAALCMVTQTWCLSMKVRSLKRLNPLMDRRSKIVKL